MAEAAHATGQGHQVRHKGVTYTISPITIPMIGAFEVWLENQAFERVERQRDRLDPATYQERLDSVTRQVCLGQFAYGTQTFREASGTPPGERYLTYLALRHNHPDMTEELAAEIWEAWVLEIRARMKADNADPNSATPPAKTPSAAS